MISRSDRKEAKNATKVSENEIATKALFALKYIGNMARFV